MSLGISPVRCAALGSQIRLPKAKNSGRWRALVRHWLHQEECARTPRIAWGERRRRVPNGPPKLHNSAGRLYYSWCVIADDCVQRGHVWILCRHATSPRYKSEIRSLNSLCLTFVPGRKVPRKSSLTRTRLGVARAMLPGMVQVKRSCATSSCIKGSCI